MAILEEVVMMKNWTVDDVMTTEVISVDPSASYRYLVDLLTAHRFSAVPVVDAARRVIGVVSEADLLRKIEYAGGGERGLLDGLRHRADRAKATARTAVDLMSAPPVVVSLGTSITAAARRLDEKHVKRLPVIDGSGRLVGIVTRGDLLRVHLRADDDIRADIETGVLRPFLADEANAITVAVAGGVVTVSGAVYRRSDAGLVDRLVRQVPGAVTVTSTLAYSFDDETLAAPSRL
ncbi:CBS domain-containing protein [Actinoplanes sp. NEAU-A12]|uniref:CBS domain-containing protein n=1 Tax=Actinoplanes sandaracinus TaxID=3045177 RepID=A0ABT6WG72_9ACTN|nr:CBS domain-containing protein [Actinoplanes sandaracinus]MDI6098717.1 CBS domain-containing protein [Actinoplanes sandaracinus]